MTKKTLNDEYKPFNKGYQPKPKEPPQTGYQPNKNEAKPNPNPPPKKP